MFVLFHVQVITKYCCTFLQMEIRLKVEYMLAMSWMTMKLLLLVMMNGDRPPGGEVVFKQQGSTSLMVATPELEPGVGKKPREENEGTGKPKEKTKVRNVIGHSMSWELEWFDPQVHTWAKSKKSVSHEKIPTKTNKYLTMEFVDSGIQKVNLFICSHNHCIYDH